MARKSKKNKVPQHPLVILTNEKNPFKPQLLQMLYQAVEYRQVAYMDGMDPETGEIVPLLVGIEHQKDGIAVRVPLARLLGSDAPNYLIPDGEGNYVSGPSEEEEGTPE